MGNSKQNAIRGTHNTLLILREAEKVKERGREREREREREGGREEGREREEKDDREDLIIWLTR